jgi:hypothetical protein
MNSPIPIEHLKTIWKTFSEVTAQIKELNEKILSLKDYIDALIPGVDTSDFVTKSQIFKYGDPEKGVEIKKGDPFTALDPDTTNLYIGGDYIGDSSSDNHSNVVIGPGTLTKGPGLTILGLRATTVGPSSTVIGFGATSVGAQSTSIGAITRTNTFSVSLGYGARALGPSSLSLGSTSYTTSETE